MELKLSKWKEEHERAGVAVLRHDKEGFEAKIREKENYYISVKGIEFTQIAAEVYTKKTGIYILLNGTQSLL